MRTFKVVLLFILAVTSISSGGYAQSNDSTSIPPPLQFAIISCYFDDPTFDIVESPIKPRIGFESLFKAARENIIYPPQAIRNNVEGTIYVKIAVAQDNTSKVEIINEEKLGYGLEEKVIEYFRLLNGLAESNGDEQ